MCYVFINRHVSVCSPRELVMAVQHCCLSRRVLSMLPLHHRPQSNPQQSPGTIFQMTVRRCLTQVRTEMNFLLIKNQNCSSHCGHKFGDLKYSNIMRRQGQIGIDGRVYGQWKLPITAVYKHMKRYSCVIKFCCMKKLWQQHNTSLRNCEFS